MEFFPRSWLAASGALDESRISKNYIYGRKSRKSLSPVRKLILLPSGCEQHPQGPGHRKELQGRFLTVPHLALWEQAPSHLGDEAIFQLQLNKTQTWLCIVFKRRSEGRMLIAGKEETWAWGLAAVLFCVSKEKWQFWNKICFRSPRDFQQLKYLIYYWYLSILYHYRRYNFTLSIF